MNKFIISSLIILGLSSPASAEYNNSYNNTNPDCSKNQTYIDNLSHNGFLPLFDFKDVFHDLDYNILYNLEKHTEVIVSKDKQGKVCLIGVGANNSFTAQNPEEVRDFFDDMLRGK